jgi:hypothetical protein
MVGLHDDVLARAGERRPNDLSRDWGTKIAARFVVHFRRPEPIYAADVRARLQ